MASNAIDTLTLPVGRLSLRAVNPNHMDEGKVKQLARNMVDEGFLQPILVRPVTGNRYEVVDGAHRLRAAKDAGLAEVPAIVREMTDAQAALLQIAMNRLRGELNITTVGRMLDELLTNGQLTTPDALLTSGYTRDEVDRLVKSVRTPSAAEVLADSKAGEYGDDDGGDEDEGVPVRPFVLELQFATREELARIKRKLRKAAGGGRSADLARGLVNLVDAE